MKLLDVNLLLYATNRDAPKHKAARDWLESVLSGPETVALPWVVLLAFLRISTKSSIFPNALTPEQALDVVDSWLGQPCVTVVHPTRRHAAVLRDLLLPLGTGGNLTTDAHLAAMALEHGAELCSCDGDFARFPGLLWSNPLAT